MKAAPSIPHRGAAQAAAMLRALSNERRLLIVVHLMEAGPLPVGALAKRVGLSQSALSQHLAKLRHCGVVAGRKQARTVLYSLSDPRVAPLLTLLGGPFTVTPLGRCDPNHDKPDGPV